MTSQKASAVEKRETKKPTRKRGKERVDALLASAAQEFADKGFEPATMTDIAAGAGASIGSLYQYFPTKDDIAGELHGRQLEALAQMLETLGGEVKGAPLIDLTARLFDCLLAFLEANPSFAEVSNRRSIDPKVKRAARAKLRQLLGALLSQSVPPVPEARLRPLAAVLLYLIRMATLLRADEDASIRDEGIEELKTMLSGHLMAIGMAT